MSAQASGVLPLRVVELLVHEDLFVLQLTELIARYPVPLAVVIEICCVVEAIVLTSAIWLPVLCVEFGPAQYAHRRVDLDRHVIDEQGDDRLDLLDHAAVGDRVNGVGPAFLKSLLAGYTQHDVADMVVDVTAGLVRGDGVPVVRDGAVIAAINANQHLGSLGEWPLWPFAGHTWL